MERLKLATVWLGGCSGCHMSFLDLDEFLIDLAGLVDIVYTPLIDAKVFPEQVDVTLRRRGRGERGQPRIRADGPGPHEDPRLLRRLRGDRQRHRHAQPAGQRPCGPAAGLPGAWRPASRVCPSEPGSCRVLLDRVVPLHAGGAGGRTSCPAARRRRRGSARCSRLLARQARRSCEGRADLQFG